MERAGCYHLQQLRAFIIILLIASRWLVNKLLPRIFIPCYIHARSIIIIPRFNIPSRSHFLPMSSMIASNVQHKHVVWILWRQHVRKIPTYFIPSVYKYVVDYV